MAARTYEEADAYVHRWADSYSRLPEVLRWRRHMRVLDWWRLLGAQWPSCDNIGKHKDRLRRYMLEAKDSHLRAMMTPAELDAWAKLPDLVTVYRGCYEINRDGLSWTLSRAMARKFPTYNRYTRHGETPLLLTGKVERSRMVLKLDREEDEVVAPTVQVVAEKHLPVPAKTTGSYDMEDEMAKAKAKTVAWLKANHPEEYAQIPQPPKHPWRR